MNMQFILPGVTEKSLEKATPTEDSDGVLTDYGMQVAHEYACGFLEGNPRRDLEDRHPELRGLFYDIRHDSNLAEEHALSFDDNSSQSIKKSSYIIPIGGGIDDHIDQMSLIYVLPFEKALTGSFI